MVSDILSEASNGIKSALHEQPTAYAPYAERLTALAAEMDAIRKELDTPPGREAASLSAWDAAYAAARAKMPDLY